MKSGSIQLIIAEDDLDDRLLMEDALNDNCIDLNNVRFSEDGDDLLNTLQNVKPLPDLIILDFNMPKKDGRMALKEIKANPKLKHIPIIIFTTSKSEEDIKLAYLEGGSTFITKPSLYSDLVETISIIKKYWFEMASFVR
ncbi:response regulator [Fulvivirga sp.]|jgi:two-component system response regulator|uniref:response regulator n=1 Tax=Fulvivirga sp. TaxID=1931237 RepID=UPI0032ECD65D